MSNMSYHDKVVVAIEAMGQSAQFASWALDQVDVEHYHRKYKANELAALLVWQFAGQAAKGDE